MSTAWAQTPPGDAGLRVDNYFLIRLNLKAATMIFLYSRDPIMHATADGVIFGPSATDFVTGGGESGTITFGSGTAAFDPQPITFTINNNQLTSFNKDIHISLYQLDSKATRSRMVWYRNAR